MESFDPASTARELFVDVPWRRYVALGDSLTEGLGDSVDGFPEGGWCQMVASGLQAIRPDLEFFNLGQRYLRTKQIRETQLERAIELKPDLVTVLAGGNDMLIENYRPPVTEEHFEAMIAALLETDATVAAMTMFDIFKTDLVPPELAAMLEEHFHQLADVICRVTAKYGVPFVDLHSLSESGDAALYSKEWQHVNMRGHAVAADQMLRRLAEQAASVRVSARAVVRSRLCRTRSYS